MMTKHNNSIEIINNTGNDDIATVFIGKLNGRSKAYLEFVESVQLPTPREKKWVLIVSTLAGCPVKCPFCDANEQRGARLSFEQILEQIDFLVSRRYPDGVVPVDKFKIQFARMGDPALNPAVINVLKALPEIYMAPGLMPCISTIAPRVGSDFLHDLIEVKNTLYGGGRFQLQFSIHTTDDSERDFLIPFSKLSLKEIAMYGERYFLKGDRKIALNFATPEGFEIDEKKLAAVFSPEIFLIKLTPVNPTRNASANKLGSLIDIERPKQTQEIIGRLNKEGFETILSIGEMEENKIGSNCGQFVSELQQNGEEITKSRTTKKNKY